MDIQRTSVKLWGGLLLSRCLLLNRQKQAIAPPQETLMSKQQKMNCRRLAAGLLLSVVATANCMSPVLAGADAGAAPDKPNAAAGSAINSGLNAAGQDFLLPFAGRMTAPAKVAANGNNNTVTLHGSVTDIDLDNSFAQRVDELLDAALSKNEATRKLDRQVAFYRSPQQQNLAAKKDTINDMVHYKGLSSSIEASDVILNEKVKVRNEASASYVKQRHVDELHHKLICQVMQIAQGLGMSDKVRGAQVIATGVNSLKALVGDQEADKTVQMLKQWNRDVKVPGYVYSQPTWDVGAYQEKLNAVTEMAMLGDPVVAEVLKRLRNYHEHSGAGKATHTLVNGGLGIATFLTPGFIIPIAVEMLRGGYLLSSGGTEEAKLVKEIYYDKRIESRWRTINAESQLALSQYQMALLQRNPMLLACSESVLSQLIGSGSIPKVLGRSVLAHKSTGAPVQTAAKHTSVQ